MVKMKDKQIWLIKALLLPQFSESKFFLRCTIMILPYFVVSAFSYVVVPFFYFSILESDPKKPAQMFSTTFSMQTKKPKVW